MCQFQRKWLIDDAFYGPHFGASDDKNGDLLCMFCVYVLIDFFSFLLNETHFFQQTVICCCDLPSNRNRLKSYGKFFFDTAKFRSFLTTLTVFDNSNKSTYTKQCTLSPQNVQKYMKKY